MNASTSMKVNNVIKYINSLKSLFTHIKSHTYSSIFVSGEIAFVLLCLLINPSIGLSLGTRLPGCPVWKSSWGL